MGRHGDILEHDGKRLTLSEWAKLTGIPAKTIYGRMVRSRWSAARALSEPVEQRRRNGGRHAAGIPRPCPRLKQHASGRAYVRWKAHGRTNERYFGVWASPEANAAYRTFAGEWAAGKFDRPEVRPGGSLHVTELALAWIAHVRATYTKDGKPTSYLHQCVSAARPLATVCPDLAAADFQPKHLREVREKWVVAGFARSTCNLYTRQLVGMFSWGVGQSLIPPAVHLALQQVETLVAGRTVAPDYAARLGVADDVIASTIPQLAPTCARKRAELTAMIQLQRLTGMRPGEVCKLRACDLDRSADVWRYTVEKPKNLHRDRTQVYYFGPKAVAILAPMLKGVPDAGRVFGFSRMAYFCAVATAAVRAKVEHWTPHQLRHSLATEVADRFRTLEHAAAAIGDSEAVAAAVYVHLDPKERAKIEVARVMG